MNTPDRVFHALWHERLDATPSEQYVPGNNLRVDAAVRALLPGKRLLDIGCGSGMLSVAVGNKFEEVYGIDIAEDAVATARGNGQTAQRIDLNSESFPFQQSFLMR
jgi:methylase of polypeptide subunit release factors